MQKLKAVKVGEGHFEVDMRGWICPHPKYAVEPLVKKLESGNRLDLLVDCPPAVDDVPNVARAVGCTVSKVEKIGDGEWKISIKN